MKIGKNLNAIALLAIIATSIFLLHPIQANSSVSKEWEFYLEGPYIKNPRVGTLRVTINWQSNTWTIGETYTVGLTITAYDLPDYIDWIKVTYAEIGLSDDITIFTYEHWTKDYSVYPLDITEHTSNIYFEAKPTQFVKEETYLIWIIKVEWQAHYSEPGYWWGSDYGWITNGYTGAGSYTPLYDPIPISVKASGLEPVYLYLLLVAVVASISIVTIFFYKRRKRIELQKFGKEDSRQH